MRLTALLCHVLRTLGLVPLSVRLTTTHRLIHPHLSQASTSLPLPGSRLPALETPQRAVTLCVYNAIYLNTDAWGEESLLLEFVKHVFGDATVWYAVVPMSRLFIVAEGIVGLRHAPVGVYGEPLRSTSTPHI